MHEEHLAARGRSKLFPTREGLLLGVQLVALYGLEQEQILEARIQGMDGWKDHAGYCRCKDAIKAIADGRAYFTDDRRILDLMAHTQQTLRVGPDEWEDACLVRPSPTKEQA